MSAVFDTLQDVIKRFIPDEEVQRLTRWVIDGLHAVSHNHEDFLNRDPATRIAAGNLSNYIYQYQTEPKPWLFHPRAWKLMLKAKPFLVVACDEPYYIMVYDLIRKREQQTGRWSEEDEKIYQKELAEWQSKQLVDPG